MPQQPERIQGAQYTVKADVWSLGLSLLELALGRFPFSDPTLTILDLVQKIVDDSEPAPRLTPEGQYPKEAEAFIDSCLVKNPDSRKTPKDLLKSDAWVHEARHSTVNLEAWANTF